MGQQRYPLDPFNHKAATVNIQGRPVRFHFHPPEDCPDCRIEATLVDAEHTPEASRNPFLAPDYAEAEDDDPRTTHVYLGNADAP